MMLVQGAIQKAVPFLLVYIQAPIGFLQFFYNIYIYIYPSDGPSAGQTQEVGMHRLG